MKAYCRKAPIPEKRHGHPDFYRKLEEMAELHSAKNKDYTFGGDPLGNFRRRSDILKIWGFDVPPVLIALIDALKQQDCMMWMLSQGYEGEVEGFDKRAMDDAVYKLIASILKKEGQ